MLRAGDHVPEIPFSEVVGKGAKDAPAQIGPIGLKFGVIPGLTTIVADSVNAHCPRLGVKMYVVVAALFNAGDHVPEIPFNEVVGKGASAAPEHIGATLAKVGVLLVPIVMVKDVVSAHCPRSGVNV